MPALRRPWISNPRRPQAGFLVPGRGNLALLLRIVDSDGNSLAFGVLPPDADSSGMRDPFALRSCRILVGVRGVSSDLGIFFLAFESRGSVLLLTLQ